MSYAAFSLLMAIVVFLGGKLFRPSRRRYTPNMPITRLDIGIHTQQSALEQYGSDL